MIWFVCCVELGVFGCMVYCDGWVDIGVIMFFEWLCFVYMFLCLMFYVFLVLVGK